MAGSPRNRARRLAEQARMDEATGDWMIRPPKNGVYGLPGKPKEPTELEIWWREQVTELERAAKERGESVEKGAHAVLASQARVFGALGVPADVAAALMGVSEGSFQAQYADSYGVGSAAMIARVAANYLRIATSGQDRYAVKAAGEILKSRGGEPWRPPAQQIEVTRPGPKANLIDSSKLTYEERQKLKVIFAAAIARESIPALEVDRDDSEDEADGGESKRS